MSNENENINCPIGIGECLTTECQYWNEKCTYRVKKSNISTRIKDEWKSMNYHRKRSTIFVVLSISFLIIGIWLYIIDEMNSFNIIISTCVVIGMLGFCEHLDALKLEKKTETRKKNEA